MTAICCYHIKFPLLGMVIKGIKGEIMKEKFLDYFFEEDEKYSRYAIRFYHLFVALGVQSIAMVLLTIINLV